MNIVGPVLSDCPPAYVHKLYGLWQSYWFDCSYVARIKKASLPIYYWEQSYNACDSCSKFTSCRGSVRFYLIIRHGEVLLSWLEQLIPEAWLIIHVIHEVYSSSYCKTVCVNVGISRSLRKLYGFSLWLSDHHFPLRSIYDTMSKQYNSQSLIGEVVFMQWPLKSS